MMKLKSVKSIMNLSKRAIVMGINDQFRRMYKKQVAMIYYGLLKSKLPRLSLSDRQSLKRIKDWDKPKRKKKESSAVNS